MSLNDIFKDNDKQGNSVIQHTLLMFKEKKIDKE